MLIALIDDGIDTSVYPEIRVKYDLSVERDGAVRERDVADRIITGHGTTCARIIAKYAPHAEFCSLRIFHRENLRASCAQLAAAMEWCLEARVPIIHMSLGTRQPNDYQRIRSIAARLIQQRQIIVAACSNSGNYSMPAYLSGVVGILADPGFEGAEYVLPAGSNLIRASSRHTIPLPSGHELTTHTANSYAAPTVTAAVHNILERREAFSMSVGRVYTELVGNPGMTLVRPDFIEDAIILNPSGFPILRQHLFFNYLGEYQGSPEAVQLSPDCKSLVYLVPQDSRVVFEYDIGQVYAGKIETLLYGGSLPERERSRLSEALVWSEDCCRYPHDLPSPLSSDQLAVINLHGRGLGAIGLMCRLRDLFIAEGFHCRGLCDFPYSYLYDLEFVPPGVSAESAIAHLSLTYRPEVLICNFQGPGQGVVDEEGSYSIFLGDEVGSHAGGLSCLKAAYDDQDIVSLYHNILGYFS